MSELHRDSFDIKDDRAADWALRKIGEIRAETADWVAFYDRKKEAIQEENAGREAFFLARLAEYFRTQPHKVTKTQESYPLPSGKLVDKTQQPTYEKDPEKLLAYARVACPEAVKVKEELDWQCLKGRIGAVYSTGEAIDSETGEVIPGLRVVPRDPVFQVQLSKEDSHGGTYDLQADL